MWLQRKPYFIPNRYITSGIWVSNQTSFLFCLFLSVTIWVTISCVKATVQVADWSLGEVKEVPGCPVFSDGRKICLTSAVKVMYPKNQGILNSREIFSGSVTYKNLLLPLDYFWQLVSQKTFYKMALCQTGHLPSSLHLRHRLKRLIETKSPSAERLWC